jgi:hypothetical protein
MMLARVTVLSFIYFTDWSIAFHCSFWSVESSPCMRNICRVLGSRENALAARSPDTESIASYRSSQAVLVMGVISATSMFARYCLYFYFFCFSYAFLIHPFRFFLMALSRLVLSLEGTLIPSCFSKVDMCFPLIRWAMASAPSDLAAFIDAYPCYLTFIDDV